MAGRWDLSFDDAIQKQFIILAFTKWPMADWLIEIR